jgi:ribosomal protein L37AE/L43A
MRKIRPRWDEGAEANTDELICPGCGGSYLHQRRATVWDRDEDSPMTRETTVSVAVSTMVAETKYCANPSARRQGLSIVFWCETCDEDEKEHELCFAQHKGVTQIFWRES